jgi:hypothetical protein
MKRRHAMPPRSKSGRFTKRRHAGHRRRRRRNPVSTVLAANPHRRRRARRHHRRATALTVRRGRPVHRRRNPHRRRRRYAHAVMVRRRRNPAGGMDRKRIGYYLKIGAFGMAGIIFVRIAKFAYTKYLEPVVLGDEGKADPKSWRAILNDFLKHVAIALATVGVDRFLMKRLGVAGENRLAFVVGGVGETVRQGVGTLVERVSPGNTWRGPLGLDGANPAPAIRDRNGQVYVLAQDGYYYKFEDMEQAGLMDRDELQGLFDRRGLAAA